MSLCSCHFPAVKVKTYWRNNNLLETSLKPQYNTLQYRSRMTSSKLQQIFVNSQNIFDGRTKTFTLLCSPRICLFKVKNYILARTMDQQESIVQAMNQQGNSMEGRHEYNNLAANSNTQNFSHMFSPYRVESGKDDNSSEAHLQTKIIHFCQNISILDRDPVPLMQL